jgi:adenylate cyclase
MQRPDPLNIEAVLDIIELANRPTPSGEGLMTGLCEIMARRAPVDRVQVAFQSIHPLIHIGVFEWHPDREPSWRPIPRTMMGSELDEVYLRSPMYVLREVTPEVRCRLTDPSQVGRFGVTPELAAQGYTDYFGLCMEQPVAGKPTLTVATRAPGGFTDAHLAALRSIWWAFQGPATRQHWYALAKTIAQTYIGTRSGARVVDGEIHRGDLQRIQAVVWFSDLRGFTRLSDTGGEAALIAALNDYFDAMGGAVSEGDGEILKFIGDAVLAVFPYEREAEAPGACARAMASARRGLAALDALNAEREASGDAPLRCGIGLHRGELVYGNIGTEERLDFTVIGRAVNLASRVEGLCGQLGEPLLATAEVAAHCGQPTISRGAFKLKGIADEVEIYGLVLT